LHVAADAQLVALVKPAFELHAPTLAARPEDVARAVAIAIKGIDASGWEVVDDLASPIRGSRGAVEVFVHARRTSIDGDRRHLTESRGNEAASSSGRHRRSLPGSGP
jgi:hypothetical protein